MNLEKFLDELEAEELSRVGPLDVKSLVDQAREKGLVMGGEAQARKLTNIEARGILTAINGRKLKALPNGCPLVKALPIDKTGGELVTNLAGVQTRWMDVSPEMARLWLLNNFNNRKVSMDTVRSYAREMVNNKWIPTHQGIAFNSRDELIDGQHRLMAIEMSGETVRMLVTFGLPTRVENTRMTGMDAVDRGKTRTVADQLKIQHGLKGGSILAGICARLAGICSPERTRRLTVGEVLDIHEAFEEAVDWVIANRPKAHGLKQVGVLAGFAFALAVDGTDGAVAEMFDQLVTGTAPEGSVITLLYRFLTSPDAILLTRGNDRALAELVLQSIWLQERGQIVSELVQDTQGIEVWRSRQPDRVKRIANMFLLPSMEAA
ncbi:hypothetical protein GCM10023213_14380 [Prosthecobacter algae]|uniref:DGQHR domain-containing protein n=1 Tax=Prosthecobacter algae TaxID=1144682 RepID=A0ABP9NZ36_9BACT